MRSGGIVVDDKAGAGPQIDDDAVRLADQPTPGAEDIWQERLQLFAVAIDVAEKLDELERRLDPEGEPPRHAALTNQRLRSMTRKRKK